MENKILDVCLNQTFNYISCATTSGFLIYQIDPFIEKKCSPFDGSLSLTHMLYTTNIVVCVGGHHVPTYKNSKYLFIWDMKDNIEICHRYCCQPIQSIQVTLSHVTVNYQDHIEVLNMNNLESITRFGTCMFPVSKSRMYNNQSLMVYTTEKKGEIRIWKKKSMVKFKSHISKILDIHINVKCNQIITISQKHIKWYSVPEYDLEKCISIEHYESTVKRTMVDSGGQYILIEYKDAHMIIIDKNTDMIWTIYIPDILFSSILLKGRGLPRIFVLTKTETCVLQLRQNRMLSCISKTKYKES